MLAACRTAVPPEPTVARTDGVVAASPHEVISLIRAGAAARGGRVANEGLDSLVIDFGATAARIAIPGEGGSGARGELRETEVHCTSLYVVRAAGEGTAVTVLDNPTYWHPDARIWLAGPHGVAPGSELLREFAAPSAR